MHAFAPCLFPAPPKAYAARELARAGGVPVEQVLAALGRTRSEGVFVTYAEAVQIGRALVAPDASRIPMPLREAPSPEREALFSIVSMGRTSRRSTGVPLPLSGTLHAGMFTSVQRLSFRSEEGVIPHVDIRN